MTATAETSLVESIGPLLPTNWWNKNSLGAHRCWPNSGSDEYKTVKDKFCSTFPAAVPTRIERVENAHLYGMYLLKKAEYPKDVSEKSLWHATSVSNFENIIKTNLDWRRAWRVKFGQGVSFSPSARYANQECNRATPTERVCLLCKVLVDSVCSGGCGTTLPAPGFDTTGGNCGLVYVKYCDNEFYPEYVVHYESPGRY